MFTIKLKMYLYSLIPFVAYWLTCGFCGCIGKSNEKIVNSVDKKTVFYNVLSVTGSAVLGTCAFLYFDIISSSVFRFWYVLIGIWWIDTIEYVTHYVMHKVPFLYKNFHKIHHQLVIPYAFGALYNSTLEAGLTSSMMMYGFYLLGISYPEFIVVTTLANIATVLDHSESLAKLGFKNKFHQLHHSKYQNKNFQQPFFTYYDKLFDTLAIENSTD